MRDFSATITQFLSGPLIFTVSSIFFKVKITGKEHLQNVDSPFIVISNHIAMYDSFMFRLVFRDISRQLPLRFMAVKRFESNFLNFLAQIGIVDLTYILFGVFVVERGKGVQRNLTEARTIIESGGNVVVYPEGRITEEHKGVGEFRIGAAVLAQETGAPVIPCVMRFGKVGFLRRDFFISIGEPVSHEEEDSIVLTHKFRGAVRGLYDGVIV